MFSQHSNLELKTENPFETIYSLAKEKDKDALSVLIASGASIDVRQGQFTAAGLLAKHGEHDAVDFLLTHFNASPNQVVFGYACGEYDTEVNKMLNEGAGIDSACAGYAYGNHATKAVKLLTHKLQETQDDLSYWRSLDRALFYFTAAGWDAKGFFLLQLDATFSEAIIGYAFGKHIGLLDSLLKENPDKSDEFPINTIYGLALGGHTELVNQYIDKIPLHDKKLAQERALWGYAHSNHLEQANLLLAEGVNPFSALFGLAYNGHGSLVIQLLKSIVSDTDPQNLFFLRTVANLEQAIGGAARGEHITLVYQLLELVPEKFKTGVLSYALSSYQMTSCLHHQGRLLQLLTLTESDELRKEIAEKAKVQSPTFDTEALLKKSAAVARLMKKHHLSFQQAIDDRRLPLMEKNKSSGFSLLNIFYRRRRSAPESGIERPSPHCA